MGSKRMLTNQPVNLAFLRSLIPTAAMYWLPSNPETCRMPPADCKAYNGNLALGPGTPKGQEEEEHQVHGRPPGLIVLMELPLSPAITVKRRATRLPIVKRRRQASRMGHTKAANAP